MDCLTPISILNPSKFISLDYCEPYVQYVRCGKCANCQETLSKEWYFRSYYEYQDTIKKNGYMLMDCLTYSEKYVPRVSRYVNVPKYLDFRCFDYSDLRLFLVRLRKKLERSGFDIKDSLRYFASTEYGTKIDCTHRSHIHILFFVTCPDLDNITLSRFIADTWKYGRTDGVPYKTRRYVQEHTIRNGVTGSMRSCKYVCKYVMKDSSFQKVVNSRLLKILHYLYRYNSFGYETFDAWMMSEDGKKYKRDLNRHLNQFHRQSLGFGASAIQTMDVDEIMRTNIITIPDGKKVVNRIGLPMYYRRKLFYNVLDIDGLKTWCPTDLGKVYLQRRKEDRLNRLINEYCVAGVNYGFVCDPVELSNYVVNQRGRIKGVFKEDATILDKLDTQLIFNYVVGSDKSHFGKKFLSKSYLGFTNNYNDCEFDSQDISTFIAENVYFDRQKEEMLSKFDELRSSYIKTSQKVFDLKQELRQKYKDLFA